VRERERERERERQSKYQSLVVTSPLCLIYVNEEEGIVSQNTTVIFGGAFYLG
jgi:hypothetical protein